MKKKDTTIKPAVCPRCGKTYITRPSISRDESLTPICPDCGIREALESIGVSADEQEKILDTIHRHRT